MKNPRRKYQVFISSTFEDLREEREHVSWEILKMRNIPAGMESFTAKDERGWKTIQRTIDDSDYFVLILAWRYGSADPDWGHSWTQHEYEYAVSRKLPILVFLRDLEPTPGTKVDADRTRIEEFRSLVRSVRLCKSWRQKEDLSREVSAALAAQISDDIDDGAGRLGWLRGDASLTPEIAEELARLSAENNRLRLEVESRQKMVMLEARLLSVDGQPVTEAIYYKPQYRFDSWSGTEDEYDFFDENKEYLDRYNMTIWCVIDIVNSGSTSALDVVVDLVVDGDKCYVISEPEQEPRSLALPRRRNANHALIETPKIKDGSWFIRQRIKSVAAGLEETLHPIGIIVPSLSFSIRYRVVDQSGYSVEGEFSPRIKVGRAKSIDLSEVSLLPKLVVME